MNGDMHGEQPSPVLSSDHGQVRLLTLNRPHRHNAIDIPLRHALAEALEGAMTDQGVRAVVLTGQGASFCSGGDITTMTRLAETAARDRVEAAQRVVRVIWGGPKPVIAAVEGVAAGAGAALALACDRVVAARGAQFSFTFSRVGLAGDLGVYASLPDRIGAARAQQLLMFGTAITGEDLRTAGLADALTEDGSARQRALEDAATLAAAAPLALRAMKRMLRPDWPEVLDREVAVQAALFDTADFAEGIAAFREHRPARFTGI
jgi:2-(1,2-epoxy-1,2-dihydrophenyl)acetyl-CoA isomerase